MTVEDFGRAILELPGVRAVSVREVPDRYTLIVEVDGGVPAEIQARIDEIRPMYILVEWSRPVATMTAAGLCEGHDANPTKQHRGTIHVVPLEGDRLLCEECRVWALKARSERAARERTAQERANARARGEHLAAPTMRRELADAIARAPRFAPIRGRR